MQRQEPRAYTRMTSTLGTGRDAHQALSDNAEGDFTVVSQDGVLLRGRITALWIISTGSLLYKPKLHKSHGGGWGGGNDSKLLIQTSWRLGRARSQDPALHSSPAPQGRLWKQGAPISHSPVELRSIQGAALAKGSKPS